MFAFVKTPYWERADEDTKEGLAELIEQLGEQVEEIELLPSAIDAWELHRHDHGSRDGGESGARVGQRTRPPLGAAAGAA